MPETRNRPYVIPLSLNGIKVLIDRESEEAWVLVPADPDRQSLAHVSDYIDGEGYEVMPEWECPSEVYADGSVRHWLAEKEDA